MAEAAALGVSAEVTNPDLMAEVDAGKVPPTAPTDWKSRIPDDVKAEKMWENFKTEGDVYKSYANLFKAQGRMVTIPDDKTAPEKTKEFWTKLGLPESAEKYALTRPETLPEGLTYFDDLEKSFAEHMFKANAPRPFVQAALDYWNNEVAPRMIAPGATPEEVQAKLKEAWGKDYDANISGAERFIRANVDEKIARAFDKLPLDQQISINTLFAKIGARMSEDGSIGLTHGTKEIAADTIAALKKRQGEIFNDPDYTRTNFRHKGLVEEMIQINRKLSEAQNS